MNEETRENEQGAAPEPTDTIDSAQAPPGAPMQTSATGSVATLEASSMQASTPSTEPSAECGEDGDVAEGVQPKTVAIEGDAAEQSQAGTEAVASEGDAEGTESRTDAPTKKKRKRRKKKKKKSESEQRQPFTAFFEGGPRAHAFRAGEIIAGRVERVERGVIVVDLFGKATAFVDEFEPREIPEPPSETTKTTEPAKGEGDEAQSPGEAGGFVEAPTDAQAQQETTVDDVASVAPDDAETISPKTAEAGEADAVAEPVNDEPEGQETVASPEVADSSETATTAESDDEGEGEAPAPVEPPPPPPMVGSIFRGRVGSVAESGHIVIINRIVDRAAAKARIAQFREEHKRVRGVVYGFNRGGFDVLVEGIRAFCPAGGMAMEPIGDPASFLGQKLEFSLPPNRGGGKSIIVSRRSILEREARKKARARLKELQVGQRLEGPVTDIRDYGVLVALGDGLDGLVHQSEVSWVRGQRPADAVKVGELVQVEVLKVQPASRKDRQGRVSLSIRRCLPDPWDEHADALTVGSIHQGKVVGTTEFGAFLEILPGIEGLLHISELGGRDIKHAKQAVSEGDLIEVLIERIDKKERRISLSKVTPEDKKAIESGEFDPAVARSLKQGGYVTVIINRVEHHGVLGTVKGVVGKRGRVYIPNRELVVEGAARKKAYAPGVEVEAKIVGKDREGQLRCSIKARHADEERRAVKEYRKEASKQGFGTFGDLLKAKLGQKEN